MTPEEVDILIIGAGLSGICTAYHLQDKCPDKSFTILEGRNNLGGTWDLFKYPGIRSDSDMATLGYRFRPWTGKQSIADGPSIMKYLTSTANDLELNKHIQYESWVKKANWSSQEKKWIVHFENKKQNTTEQIKCSFILGCCGYYSYKKGYTPEFEGLEHYNGKFIHPQKWPKNFDYKDKNIVVIGSGATAVTLLPALADGGAKQVTMLQRSPTYYIIVPKFDTSIKTLSKVMSKKTAFAIVRMRNILIAHFIYNLSKKFPKRMKRLMIKQVTKKLPEGYDVKKHFTPNYMPWDQRVCLTPNGDLFSAISNGDCSVVTDHIRQFTENGILLKSGEELEADIIVSATGLNLVLFGGIKITVDNKKINLKDSLAYKSGCMMSNVPNIVSISGYTNASWTLKADLIAEYICRLINHMDKKGYKQVTPTLNRTIKTRPFMENFSSGYIQRAIPYFPSQGTKRPWIIYQNYFKDYFYLRYGKLEDKDITFS